MKIRLLRAVTPNIKSISFIQATGTFTRFSFFSDSSNGIMLKRLHLLLVALLLHSFVIGQNISNYSFATSTSGSLALDANGNAIDMNTNFIQMIGENTSGTSASAIMNLNLDVDPFAAPFEFWFGGVRYTQFSVNDNGVMRLAINNATSVGTVSAIGAAAAPIISPFTQILETGRIGRIRTKIVGTAPNRTLVVQWRDMEIPAASVTDDGTFQARLYETTGVVEFVYGGMRAGWITSAAPTFQVGISTNTLLNCQSVNVAANTSSVGAPTANTYTIASPIVNLNSTADGSRRVYSFTPPASVAAPTGLNFTAVTQTSMTLNWTDNASNENGYHIYRSDDGGTTYNWVAQTAANIQTYNVANINTNLIPGRTYYWRIKAVSEGAESAVLQNSQATNAAGTKTAVTSGVWTAITWSPAGVPTATDNVIIPTGLTVTMTAATAVNNLTVNGTLQFNTATVFTFTVNGDLTVNTGGVFSKTTTGAQVLTIGGSAAANPKAGNVIVDGTFDMFSTVGATVYFYGTVNSTVTGSGTIDLGPLTYVNKGSGITSILDFQRGYTGSGVATTGPFIINTGTLKISGSFTQSNNVFATAAPTIAGGFWLDNSNFTVGAQAGIITVGTGALNTGLFRLSNGTMSVGTLTGHNLAFNSNATSIIEGGALNVASRFGVAAVGNIFNYKQSGGAIITTTVANAQVGLGGFDIGSSTSSYMEMSGGTVVVRNTSTGSPKVDLRGALGSEKITGGSVTLGDGSTIAGVKTFAIYNGGSVPDFTISNTSANHGATIFAGTTGFTVRGNFNHPGTGVFNLGGFNTVFNGTITNSGTFTANTAGSGVTFRGTTAQTLGGTITANTIANVSVINAAGATITSTLIVSQQISLIEGALASGGTITLGAAAPFNMTKDNGTLAATPTFNYGTAAISYNYLHLGANAGAVTPGVELPATLTNSNSVININNYNGINLNAPLSSYNLGLHYGVLKTDATNLINVTNTTNASAIVGGHVNSYVNGPLIRNFLNNPSVTFRFPVGKTEFNEFDMYTTAAPGNTSTLQVEYLTGTPSAAGSGVTSLDAGYWEVQKLAGAATFPTVTVTLNKSGMTPITRAAYSTAQPGTYDNIGGIASGNVIAAGATSAGIGYFATGSSTTLSGTYTTYNNLTEIANALRYFQVTGDVIFELPNTYDDNTETLPIVFKAFNTDGTDWNVTIRPAAGASLETSLDPGSTIPLIDLDGIDRLTFDGRAGGAGTSINWIFRNTRTAATVGPAFRFINDATYNTLNYLQVESQNIATNSGSIFFSTSAGLTLGNSNNTVSNSDIRENTVTSATPTNAVFSYGTSAAISNLNNTITNNRIFNFSYASGSANGVFVSLYNGAWTITNNHFYQTASRAGGNTLDYGIQINNTNVGSEGYTVTGNFIGGSSSNAGGTAWTYTGVNGQGLYGIYINANSSATNCLIKNNTITNISLSRATVTNATNYFTGIYSASGSNTIENNIIGAATGTGALSFTSAYTALSTAYGIFVSTGNEVVTGNTIGGITMSGTTTAMPLAFTGIYVAGTGITTISNNLVGSLTSPGSISLPTAYLSTALQSVIGINHLATGVGTISGNNIANINNAYTGSTAGAGQVIGINTGTSGTKTVSGNNIFQLNSASALAGTGAAASVIGISSNSPTVSQVITDNIIHSLGNSNTSAAVNVIGINMAGVTTLTNNVVARNFIHSLSLASTSTAASIIGINAVGGVATYHNNMVRLGIDSLGASITTANSIIGINQITIILNNYFYFNSVYIGGTGVGTGAANTYAYNKTAGTTAVQLYNNILANARGNSSTGGSHYAIGVNATTAFLSNYNLLRANGTGGLVGIIGATPYSTLPLWQGGSSQDANSLYGSAGFVNATGNAAAVNLHINPAVGTQAESSGTPIAAVTTDYDTDIRYGYPGTTSTGTAVDIGADEGNFLPVDLTPPNITYTIIPVIQTTLSGPTLSAVITDASGVEITTGTAPRIYFRRTTDANTFNTNSSGTAGWKYVETASISSPFSFTIDYSLLSGGTGLTGGETIEYFVVAQDQASTPNFGSNIATFATLPLDVNLASANFPVSATNSYFVNVLSGTVTVGTSGTYTSLTNAGGLFEAINTGALSSNLIAEITTDLTAELGTFALNQWTEVGGSGYTLTIRPDAGTDRVISGNYNGAAAVTAGLFRFDGADRVTIDGRNPSNIPAGGRHLLFRNLNVVSSNTNATFMLINDATNNNFQYTIFEGGSISSTNAVFRIAANIAASGTASDNNLIDNCFIRDNQTGTRPANGIYAIGNSAAIGHDNITISNNQIYNTFNPAVQSSGITVGLYNTAWTIDGNHIYQATTLTGTTASIARYGILVASTSTAADNFIIKNNFIGGTTVNAGGTAMTTLGAVNQSFVGIYLAALSTANNSVIKDNVIKNIVHTHATTVNTLLFVGIRSASGNNLITGNTIGAATGTGSIAINSSIAGLSNVYGIYTDAGTVTISNDTIGSFTLTGSTTTVALAFTGIHTNTGLPTITGNVIGSRTTGNSIRILPIGLSPSTSIHTVYGINTLGLATTISGNTIANISNSYAGTTTTAITAGITTTTAAVVRTITNNEIFGISTNSAHIGVGVTPTMAGIILNGTTAGGTNTISGNRIHSFINGYTGANAVTIAGIVYNGNTTSGTVNGNFVHSLLLEGTGTASSIFGINALAGVATYSNNMVRLGIDEIGDDITTGYAITGLSQASTTAGNNFYFNSVYIGGSGVVSASNTFAFNRIAGTATTTLRNNIFANFRSNASGTGANYSMGFNALTNLTTNNNILYYPGTGGAAVLNAGTPVATLALWQSGARDDLSFDADPLFVNPTGDASIVDLHLNALLPNQAESGGVGVGIFADYDTNVRFGGGGYAGSGTAPDIGADENDFGTLDITPPTISYTLILDQLTFTSPTLVATITDANGVDAGAGKPRLYYKKTSENNTIAGNTSGDNGWKYVETSSGSSPFSFSPDYTLLTSGAVAEGDVIQYFVVAQDMTPNVAINSGIYTTAPSSVALASGNFPITGTINSYMIRILNGTITVGTAGDYPSLTNAGGLFDNINTSSLSGNVTVNILNDLLLETGVIALNQWPEVGAGNYSLTIQSGTGSAVTARITTGQGTTGFIKLNGADRVNFNGGSGTDRKLILQNISTAGAASTITFYNDATNNTFNNCIIEGSATSNTTGVINFGVAGTGLGNDDNTITNNSIRDYNGVLPATGIYSLGTAAKENSGNTITGNTIANYFNATANSYGIFISSNTINWNISNNAFFQTATRTVTTASTFYAGIYINNSTGSGFIIDGNQIAGNAADGTGTMTYTSTVSPTFAGIYAWVNSNTTQITNNTIKNISFTTISAGTANHGIFSGIYVYPTAASVAVTGNTVGSSTGNGSITVNLNGSGSAQMSGIKVECTGTATSISGNIVGSITSNGSIATNTGLTIYGINLSDGSATINLNRIGSSVTANSIQSVGNATTNPANVYGVYATASASYSPVITNNRIYNVSNLNTNGTSASIAGIQTSSGGQYTITGNLVRNLTGSTATLGTIASPSVIGISMNTANSSALTISQDTVYALSNTTSNNAFVTGIYFSGSTGTSYVVSRNIVHSLTPSTGATSVLTGIQIASGGAQSVTVNNNMVRLGINPAGSSITNAVLTSGIEITSTATTNVFHNSVYIGGAVSGTSAINSYALRRTAVTGTVNIQNNIFMNARTQSSGGKHYAIYTPNITTFTSNYNILFAIGTGTYTGLFAAADQATLANWRTATTNRDLNSLSCDPGFIAPAADAATVDLHLDPINGTSAEGRGNPVAMSPAVTIDIDGDTRTTGIDQVDIGADAGAYTGLTAPTLTAEADGVVTPTSACSGSALLLESKPVGGSICGAWEYSWFNGSNYWNGTAFASATEVFDIAWEDITTPALIATTAFTVKVRCQGDVDNCIAPKTSFVSVTIFNSPASLTSTIGVPATGLDHHITLSWPTVSGVTSYDLEVSTDNLSWSTAYTGSALTYDFSAGDNPNAPYYFRVRSNTVTGGCTWMNSTIFPIYTAADIAGLVTLSSVTYNSISVTLNAESPVANPAITTYSIFNTNTSKYVQADGTLNATEVFQTMAAWGTIVVNGLAPTTNYCFYAKAKDQTGGVLRFVTTTVCATTLTPVFTGTVTVGTGGDFLSLTNDGGLFNLINLGSLSGNVTANVISDITETGTHALNEWVETGVGTYTLTIESSAGVDRQLSGSYNGAALATNGLIRMNGADRVTFNGGTGSNQHLRFRNTNTGNFASVFTFINDASSITLNNLYIEGASASVNNGVVYFGTAAVSGNGNDNITITNSDIRDITTLTAIPANGIFGLGTASPRTNDNVTISNNNIYNYHAAGNSAGMNIGTGNNGWTISGNSIYQTNTPTTASNSTAIYIDYTANSSAFTVSGNYIGGNAPLAAGTLTVSAPSADYRYSGIYVNLGTSTTSNVLNNTIKNISIATNTSFQTGQSAFSAIFIDGGTTNVNNNNIGSLTTTGSIDINISSGASLLTKVYGINIQTNDSIKISNNTIGGINFRNNASSTTAMGQLFGIYSNTTAIAGSVTITGNTIGGTIANSLNNSTGNAYTSTGNIYTIGIQNFATRPANISGNTIQNVAYTANGNATGSVQVIGILSNNNSAVNSITNNTISSLSTSSPSILTAANTPLMGISMIATAAGQTISGNTISSVIHTHASAAVQTHGIYYSGPTSGTNIVTKNNVHSFRLSTTSGTAAINGIYLAAGTVSATNNMIRLGIDDAAASLTNAHIISGITKDNTAATTIAFNSVYIGGSGVGTTAANTFAFRRLQTGVDDIRNNIFINARSNSSTGGNHYAYVLNVATNATSNYNIYQTPGTGGSLFSLNGGTTAIPTLQGWNIANPTQDLNSGVGNPNFVNPTAGNPNLHIANPSPAESAGIDIVSVTEDFDGDVRASNTPTDIGADAANVSPVDIIRPTITITPITSLPLDCDGIGVEATLTATITDAGTGVGSPAPTLWYRRSAPTATSWTYVSGTIASGTAYVGTWEFALSLPSAVTGESYQYYFVAQDQAGTPNIGYTNFDALTPVHSSVSVQVTAPNSPGTFTISGSPLSGTVTVGSGGDYPTFTAVTTGLFQAINNSGLKGDLIVNVITNITETGAVALNQWFDYCGGPYSVLIQPLNASVKVISSTLNAGTGVITLNGADRVTIDGSFSGSGRYLQFGNASTNTSAAATIALQNDATNNAFLNIIVESGSQNGNSGVIALLGSTGSTGNSNNLFENNLIRGNGSWARTLLYSSGSVGAKNNTNIIRNNQFYNFLLWSGGSNRAYGINITPTGNGGNWTIVGNSIYNTGINGQSTQSAMVFEPGSGSSNNIIKGNWIGGSAEKCGSAGGVTYWGNTWSPNGVENQVVGISVNAGTVVIDSNNVSNIFIDAPYYSGFIGVNIQGATNATVTNNVFGKGLNGTPDNSQLIKVSGGSITYYQPGYIYGIWNRSTTTSMTTYSKNDFYYMHQSGAYEGGNVHCIAHQTNGPATITENRINGPQAAGLYYNQFGIRFEPNASTTGNIISQNIVAGPYLNAAATDNDANNFGIYARSNNGLSHSGVISRNAVWDMRSASYGGQTATEGIYVSCVPGGSGAGSWDITNNQVTLKNNGVTTNCVALYGIDVALASGTTNVNYNTVYISGSNGGTGLAGMDFSSYAFFRQKGGTGTGSGDAMSLKNNIFINYRLVSTSAVSGHFAIGNYATALIGTNWNVSDNNFLATANGSKSYLGQWGTSTQATLANWQSASSKDAGSFTATYSAGASNFGSGLLNPDNLFLNPLSDLHISTTDAQSYRFINDRGASIALNIDYDGETRDASTPDIGADEFLSNINDAGIIALSPACSGNQLTVTIENFGLVTLNTVTVNWSVGGVTQTPQIFTGLALPPGESVVKTLTPTFSFTAGTPYTIVSWTTLPNSIVDTDPSNDSYTASPAYYGFPTTVYIGTGSGTWFPTYSALFNALNNSSLTGNVIVNVRANSTEPTSPAQPTFLNILQQCGGSYTVTIKPQSATVYTATGNSGTTENPGMIGFNGATNVIIDGSFGGSGKYLTFKNTNATYPVVHFRNDANLITYSNSNIQGNNNTTYVSGGISTIPGIVFFGNGKVGGTGNTAITLSGNTIKSDVSGVAANAIFSYNTTLGTTNFGNSILNNEIANFSQTGVYLPDGALNGNAWNISGNNIYCATNMASYQTIVPQHIAIYVKAAGSNSHIIKHNVIGGSAAGATGKWTNSNNSLDFEGIRLEIGGNASQITQVDSNTVKNIQLIGTGLSMFIGIRVKTGFANINGNTIGDTLGTFGSPSIEVAGSGVANGSNDNVAVLGIWNYSTDASEIRNNTIAGIKNSGGYSYLNGIRRGTRDFGTNALNVYAGKSIITGNTIANLYSGTGISNVYQNGTNVDRSWPAALTGIALRSDYATDNLVDSNTVKNLNAYSTYNRWVRVNGIAVNGSTTIKNNGTVSRNRISNLDNHNGGNAGANTFSPSISGLCIGGSENTSAGSGYIANGSFTVSNNMIYLAPDADPANAYNNAEVYGILDVTKQGNTNNYYYNSIYIGGTGKFSAPSGGIVDNHSFAFLRCASGDGSTNGASTTLKNNILINNRVSGISNSYALGNQASNLATGFSTSNINNNLIAVGDSTLAYNSNNGTGFGAGTNYSLTGYRALGFDSNGEFAQTTTGASVYTGTFSGNLLNPTAGNLFVNPTAVYPLSFLNISETDLVSAGFVKNQGVAIVAVTNDIDNEIRNATTPTIGADEMVVCPLPIITLQPADVTACPGNTQFVVTATSALPIVYAWEQSTDGVTWTALADGGIYSGTDNDTLTLTGITALQDGYFFKVKVKACDSLYSNTVSLTISNPPVITALSPLTFINQICAESNTSFEVTASGSGTLTYAWEVDMGSGWTAVTNTAVYSGAATNKLSLSNVPRTYDGYLYRAIVSSSACILKDTSITGTLTIIYAEVTVEPVASLNLCAGTPAIVFVTAIGSSTFSYQWQLSTDGGTNWNNISDGAVYNGVTNDTLTLLSPVTGMLGYKYRANVSASFCGDQSAVATVTSVGTSPVVVLYDPAAFVNTVCAGSTVNFKIKATGTTPTFQWQLSTDAGLSFSNLATGAPYSITSAADSTTLAVSTSVGNAATLNETQYRIIVSGSCAPPDTSEIFFLNVSTLPVYSLQPVNTPVCIGSDANLTADADAVGSMLQFWQYYNGATWNNVNNGVPTGVTYAGNFSESLTVSTSGSTPTSAYSYRLVSQTLCGAVNSSTAIVTVNPILTASVSIVALPSNVVCTGTSVSFTATPVNGGTTPVYQWYKNGNPVGIDSDTYTDAGLATSDAIYVEMTSNAVCVTPAMSTSGTITMTVNSPLPVSVSISTPSLTVCSGDAITFTATPTNGGATPSYAWTVNGSPAGTDSPTFITSSLVNGDVVQCVLTSSDVCVSGNPATSNTQTMTVQFQGQWLGYTNDWDTPSNWGCSTLPTSTTVVVITATPIGGFFPEVYSVGTSTVLDLTINAGATVTITTGNDLSVFGDLTNNGTASLGAGAVKFRGLVSHSISGSTNTTFGILEVSNTSAGIAVMLNQLINVSNAVTMTNGSLDLNGYDIDLGTTGELQNETNTNRVFGAGEIKTSKMLSASTTYNNIAGLGVSITTDVNAPLQTEIDRGHISQVVAGVNNSIQRYFDISPTVNTALDATLRINYFQDEIIDIDGIDPSENELIPWRSTDGGVTWEGQFFPAQISNDNVANWVQMTQIPAFSRWTLSDWLTEPLPIQLLNFTAIANENAVDLAWTTLSEVNNNFFTVERSIDAVNFEEVLKKDGAGNSTTIHNYSDVDRNPHMGISYYRLKQTDYNGAYTHSQIVPVNFNRSIRPAVNAFVNANLDIAITIDASISEDANLYLYDISGKLIISETVGLTKGKQSNLLKNPGIAPGVYLLSVQAEHLKHIQKLVIR